MTSKQKSELLYWRLGVAGFFLSLLLIGIGISHWGGGRSPDREVRVQEVQRDRRLEEADRLTEQSKEINARMFRGEITPDEAMRQHREIERRMQQLSR